MRELEDRYPEIIWAEEERDLTFKTIQELYNI